MIIRAEEKKQKGERKGMLLRYLRHWLYLIF